MSWLAEITRQTTATATDGTVTHAPRRRVTGEWMPSVHKAFSEAISRMNGGVGGRHDAALAGAAALLRLEDIGVVGASEALLELGSTFRLLISADRASPEQARKEWDDMIEGGRELVARTPSTAEAAYVEHADIDLSDLIAPIADRPKGGDGDDGSDPIAHLTPVHWPTVWQDESTEEWLIEPMIVDHRQHQMYAPAKTRKSLLAEGAAAALASGRPFLDKPESEPVDVLVIDFENDIIIDIRERLTDFGYAPTDLERLHWYSFPSMGALDSARGAEDLDALILRHRPRFVLLDSFARVVDGPENDADTIRAYYRHAGVVLKSHRIASLRLDNTGKDLSAGARGSSAKCDDVDVVWQLRARDGGLQLKRDAQRSNIVPEYVNLKCVDEPFLNFVIEGDSWPAGTKAAAGLLDRLGVRTDATVSAARSALRAANEKCAQEVLAAAVKYRKKAVTRSVTAVSDLIVTPDVTASVDVLSPGRNAIRNAA